MSLGTFTVEPKPGTVSALEDFVQLSRVLYGICGADLSVAISWGHFAMEWERFWMCGRVGEDETECTPSSIPSEGKNASNDRLSQGSYTRAPLEGRVRRYGHPSQSVHRGET